MLRLYTALWQKGLYVHLEMVSACPSAHSSFEVWFGFVYIRILSGKFKGEKRINGRLTV